MKNITHGAKVGVYLRCSQSEQKNSIPDQREVIDPIIDELGLDVVDVYIDRGEPGGTINERPELKRMLADAARGRFDFVLFYNISRMSRGGNAHFWWIAKELLDVRVLIYDCTARQLVTEEVAVQMSIKANEAYQRNIDMAQDVTRTMILNQTKRNDDPGRRAPYGMDRLFVDDDGKPVHQIRLLADGTKQVLDPVTKEVKISVPKGERFTKNTVYGVVLTPGDPERVKVMQRCFTMARTMSATQVVNVLNCEGIPGPNGGRWTASTMRELLQNRAFVGDVIYNKRQESKYFRIENNEAVLLDYLDHGRINLKDNDEDQWIVRENAHEGIVDRELFDAVQAATDARRNCPHGTPRSKKRDYPLSSLIVCGRCGEPIQGHTNTSGKAKNSRRYPYYICSAARKFGKAACAPYSIPADRVEGFVLTVLRKIFLAREAKAAVRRGLESSLAESGDPLEEVKRLEKELDAVEHKKDALVRSLDPDDVDFLAKQISGLRKEQQKLQRLLDVARKRTRQGDKRRLIEDAMHLYERTVKGVKDGSLQSLRDMLRAMGLKIVFDPERKEGTLRLDPFGQSVSG